MMSTRRESNRSFCLGRVAATAIMVLVGIGVFTGSAAAQNTPVVLDNYMAWWDQVGSPPSNAATQCAAMIEVVNDLEINQFTTDTPPKPTQGLGDDHVAAVATTVSHFQRWCVAWSGLSTKRDQDDADALMRGVTRGTTRITTDAADNVFDVRGWWASLTGQAARNIAIGSAADVAAAYPSSASDSTRMKINAAYAALMGDMMMPTEGAPALPLVGIGILGLLLAGRGAWLRRRA